MANQITGSGIPTQIKVMGNVNPPSTTPGRNGVQLSLSGLNGPTSFQLNPILLDPLNVPVPLGTALVLSAVAASSIGVLTLSAAAASNGSVTVYTGTITGGGSNALAGDTFTVAGFTNAVNNGAFICTASTTTTLTLENLNAVAETHAGTATPEQGTAVYTGTITGGGSNALAGFTFVIAGFTNAANNGTFIATASSATTLTLTNDVAVVESHAATATSEETTNPLKYWVQASKGITGNTFQPTGTVQAVATCSATGLIATNGVVGHTVVEVSFPFANNSIGATGAITPNPMTGLPLQKIFAEVNVKVVL